MVSVCQRKPVQETEAKFRLTHFKILLQRIFQNAVYKKDRQVQYGTFSVDTIVVATFLKLKIEFDKYGRFSKFV